MSESPIAFDTTLELCGEKHRRIVLAVLATERRSVTVSDLTELIHIHNDQTQGIDASGWVPTEIQASLHHVHIPKLESAGVVEYDSKRRLVEPTEEFDQLRPQISAILGIDSDLDGGEYPSR